MKRFNEIKVIVAFWLLYGILSFITWFNTGKKFVDILVIIGIGLFLTFIFVISDLIAMSFHRNIAIAKKVITPIVDESKNKEIKEVLPINPIKKARKKRVKNVDVKDAEIKEDKQEIKEVKQEPNLTPAHFDNVFKENFEDVRDLD